jgi:hypothetical protein
MPRNGPDGSLERYFHCKLVLGFNQVISILQQQHDAFQIGRRELRLDETEPERDHTRLADSPRN